MLENSDRLLTIDLRIDSKDDKVNRIESNNTCLSNIFPCSFSRGNPVRKNPFAVLRCFNIFVLISSIKTSAGTNRPWDIYLAKTTPFTDLVWTSSRSISELDIINQWNFSDTFFDCVAKRKKKKIQQNFYLYVTL